MTRSAMSTLLVCAAVLAAPSTAHASDEAFEFWLNPSVDYDIDDENTLELGTAQRLRSESDGRVSLIRASAEGRRAARRLRRATDAIFEELMGDWNARDLADLSGLLERLVRDLGAKAAAGRSAR